MQLAIKEKGLELERLNNEFNEKKQSFLERNENPTEFLMKLEKSSNALTQRINQKMNKKMRFHLQGQDEVIVFTKSKTQVKQKRKWTADRKKKNRVIYKEKQKQKKRERVDMLVNKIKNENVVVNLSQEELPKSV